MESVSRQEYDLDFQAVATDWYVALSPTAYSPHSSDSTRNTLAKLARDATRLLVSKNYDSTDSERIGESLASLNYIQGTALGISIRVLSDAWLAGHPALANHLHRMTDLFADMANGYSMAVTNTILNHQEAIRDAQVVTLRELHKDLESQRDLLRLTAERLQALHDVESGILAARSSEEIAHIALTHIVRIIPCQNATIMTVNSNSHYFTILASENLPGSLGAQFPFSSIADETMEKLRDGQSHVINDISAIQQQTASMQFAHQFGARSVLIIPMATAGKLNGLLTLLSAEPSAFSDEQGLIGHQIADSVAIALHNRRLLVTEQKARQESETLREVAVSLGSTLDREELLDHILVQLQQVLPYDGAFILLAPEGSRQVIVQRGFHPSAISSLNNIDKLPANMRKLIALREPVLISDTRSDPDWIVFPWSTDVRCWLGVPLLSHGGLTGILALDKHEPDFYQQSDVDLALAFANQAAIAIDNARLYREIQQHAETLQDHITARTRDLSALYEIAAISSRYLDVQSVLSAGLARMLDDLGFASGAVHTLDNALENLSLIAYQNLDTSQVKNTERIDASSSFSAQLLSSQDPIAIADAQHDAGVGDFPMPVFANYYLGVPMRARGETIGILSLYSEQPRQLSVDEIKLLASIANHLGVAVDNADLRRQAEQLAVIKERERLARDLHDSATQSLFSLTLFAAAAREKAISGQFERTLHYLDEIRDTANQTHREMRLLLYELGSSEPQERQLKEALKQRLRAVEGRSGITASLHARHKTNLAPKLDHALYYIANEALNNALKHSGGTRMKVEIEDDEDQIMLFVSDDGDGFDLQEAQDGPGLGLTNMHKRAEALGGQLSIITAPGQGTKILARIPWRE